MSGPKLLRFGSEDVFKILIGLDPPIFYDIISEHIFPLVKSVGHFYQVYKFAISGTFHVIPNEKEE